MKWMWNALSSQQKECIIKRPLLMLSDHVWTSAHASTPPGYIASDTLLFSLVRISHMKRGSYRWRVPGAGKWSAKIKMSTITKHIGFFGLFMLNIEIEMPKTASEMFLLIVWWPMPDVICIKIVIVLSCCVRCPLRLAYTWAIALSSA